MHPDEPPPAPDFGAHALPPWADAVRRSAALVPRRWMVSLLRRLATLGRQDPFDVTVFATMHARLHLADNRSEKRAFAGPQFWDRRERARLAAELAEVPDGPFHFVDAGANVGLYSLALLASARAEGVALRGLAIECDPTNIARLRFNLGASGADEIAVVEYALAAEAGTLHLAPAVPGNRGEIRVAAEGVAVRARPLHDVVTEAGFPRIDALKIDIEGMEQAVLAPFFDTAPPALWPRLIVVETGRGEGAEILALLETHGYVLEARPGINSIFSLPQRAMAEQPDGEA
ncbi:MAG: FkbM family methyltransferase [Pseudomonadota bacterium]